MEELLSAILAIVLWRVVAGALVGALLAFALAAAFPSFNAAAGFTIVFLGIASGVVWQAVVSSTCSAATRHPPMSRVVAFLGLAAVGGLWGSLVEAAAGSPIVALIVLFLSPSLLSPLAAKLSHTSVSQRQVLFATCAFAIGYAIPYAINGLASTPGT
ncbi:hypothetical protein [Caldimonas sp. KR1-144]|uniref:hypothetical protein n=1 Tax=Caldimonas sp. KR1-144 TaxID=3400911 RepID=UPI003C1073C2